MEKAFMMTLLVIVCRKGVPFQVLNVINEDDKMFYKVHYCKNCIYYDDSSLK